MIQRVGRTGRKRDGRVVCLVSEGAEEKTMLQSKSAEKTLGQALKKPDSFSVVRGTPMFPQVPVLRKLDMSVAKDFHLSQLGGNGLAAKSRRDPSDSSKIRFENMDWRLNDAQERHREAMFGDIIFSTCRELQSSEGQLQQVLRKRFLRARTRSISSHVHRRKHIPASFGISRGILLRVEREYGKQIDERVLFNRGMNTARKSRRESGVLQLLFPFERSPATDSLDRSLLKMSLSASAVDDSYTKASPASPSLLHSQHNLDSSRDEAADSSVDITMTGATRPQNPYRSQNSECSGNNDVSWQIQKGVVQLHVVENAEATGDGLADFVLNIQCPPAEVDDFRLPTPSVSSSSENSGTDDDSIDEKNAPGHSASQSLKANVDAPAKKGIAAVQSSNMLPEGDREVQERPDDLPLSVQLSEKMQEAFRLPTQESSSEEDESSDDESDEELSSHAVSSETTFRPPDEINVATMENQNSAQSSLKEGDELDVKTSQEVDIRKPSALQTERPNSLEAMEVDTSQLLVDTLDDERERKCRAPNGESSTFAAPCPFADGGAELVDTPHSVATPLVPFAAADSGMELTNTPQCDGAGRMLPPPARLMASYDSQCSASKDDADDIVCAVCFDGCSPDNNPIVLCDGPNNDLSCPLAVHKLCYSISVALEETDNWHCDICAFRQQRPSKKRALMQCFVCEKNDGPLKEMPESAGQTWFHPHCRYAVVNQNACCQFCSSFGGTRCASEGCTKYAHPHCGLKSKRPWIVLAYASSDSSPRILSSHDVIGCNIYCPQHKDQVCRSLVAIGVHPSKAPVPPRYVIVASKLRDNNNGAASAPGAAQRKRLRKMSKGSGKNERPKGVASFKSADGSVESREQKRQRVLQRMKERQNEMQHCRFLDLEVDIDADEDADGDFGEEDEARRIEEEEAFHDDFINDSSQLGYTQDDLDRLGLSENVETPIESGAIHRRVDAMKERMNQFATPIFNRRMLKHGRGRQNATPGSISNEWDQPTPHSAPSSQKGLGNMHFIRSVLEHHRNGGEADAIEEMYRTVVRDTSPLEDDRPTPGKDPAGPMMLQYVASDSEESSDSDDDGEETQGNSHSSAVTGAANGNAQNAHEPEPRGAAKPTGLTAGQLAVIERKREEALRRKQQFQSQK